jgi:hypothetical protein
VCWTPLFSAMTLAMFDFRPIAIFQMVTTLCDGVDTVGMVVKHVEDSQKVLFSQPPVDQIRIGNIHVDHLPLNLPVGPLVNGLHVGRIPIGQPLVMVVPPWHVIITKF